MADLLIQGMHLPKLGHVTTITIYHDGTVADKMGNVETVKAVELPPHGNLKDADKIADSLKCFWISREDEYFSLKIKNTVVTEILKDSPTIVPASKEK